MTPQELKNSILQMAIQGKLVEQRPEEGTAEELYQQIQAEKQRLIKAGIIKKEKPLPEITEDEKPFDIPESWKWVRLRSIVFNRGQVTPQSTFSYIDIGSIDNKKQCLNPEESFIEANKAPSRARKVVKYGDILYSTVRPYLHNMCIIDREFSCTPIASTGFAVMTCLSGVYNKYLFYYLMSPTFDNYANHTENSKGVAYPAINDDRLYRAIIAIPPFAEQKRIIAKIEELMPYIDSYEKAWSKLEDLNKCFSTELRKSILQTAIQGKLVEQRPEEGTGEELIPLCKDDKARSIREGKHRNEAFRGAITKDNCIPFEIPDSWIWMFISDMSLFQEGPGIMAVDFRSAGVPLIRIAGMQTDIVSLEGCNYLDEDMVKLKWSHFRLDLGDIVISTSASMDKIAEVNEECVGSIPYTGLIRFKMYGGIDKNYFRWFIKSPCYMRQVNEQKAGGTIKHYGPSHLRKMVIPIPPLAEQKRIVAKIEEIMPLCERLKQLL